MGLQPGGHRRADRRRELLRTGASRGSILLEPSSDPTSSTKGRHGAVRLSQKSAKISTNNPWLAYILARAIATTPMRCSPKLAQEYPDIPRLCHAIASAAQQAILGAPKPSFLQVVRKGEPDSRSENHSNFPVWEEEQDERERSDRH